MNAKHEPHPGAPRPARWRRLAPWLLVIPFIGTLWVASYASLTPRLWGIPFFYWYQFLWIAIGSVLTILVYLVERPARETREEREP
ncbi:MAG TPA: DUF3311 domain-containing protein [Gemmatimonadaceae bacterium]|nr:DUF3311 domain-containing protein [Gemmatimonadaceae bacterium]